MLKILLQSKIVVSVVLISLIILSTLFIYIPKVTEHNTIETVVRNSQNTVAQIKLTRAYYVNSVVGDVKKYATNLRFDYDHQGVNGKLPFPTTTIHDLSKIFSDNTGVKFQFYSNYPFEPKKDRVLTASQKEALKYIQKDKDGLWIKRDTIDGKDVLRVAVADYMTEQACVDCHNNHKDKTWMQGHWKLGDKRGVLEVITFLDKDLAANNEMRNKILIFIAGALLVLIVYYSIMLIKRENELLSANDFLDAKVKDEVSKNMQKEKQLIDQNRMAVMGEMMRAIIHQWKQPLNGISISNSTIDLHIDMDDFDKDLLKKQTQSIENQIKYMGTTLEDFRDFFKVQEKSKFKLDDCVAEVLKLIGKVYEIQNIIVETDFTNNIFIDGYKNEFNQVLINIFNNARDAIEDNKPEIRTIFVKTFAQKDSVIITITDCAGGIPLDVMDKIFEPYVTTKGHYGTGIGLDMSKTIIEKIGGKISVKNVTTKIDNISYKGAQFIITLPLQ